MASVHPLTLSTNITVEQNDPSQTEPPHRPLAANLHSSRENHEETRSSCGTITSSLAKVVSPDSLYIAHLIACFNDFVFTGVSVVCNV